MDIKEEEEIKKEFQLERVILFTDAVFAIILTIMVLDIKLPESLHDVNDAHMKGTFKELMVKFLAYCLTFGLVARFWVMHLKLFRYLKDYDRTLLGLNLFFLFTVTLFPFAVSLITRKIDPESTAFSWVWTTYIFVLYSAIFTQSLMSKYLISKKETLCINTGQLETILQWKINRANLYMIPVLIVAIIVFNIFHLPYYYAMSTVAGYGIIISRVRKKYYPREHEGPILVRLYKYVKYTRLKKRAAYVIKK